MRYTKEFIYEIGSVPVYEEKRGSIFLKAKLEGIEKNGHTFTPEKFSISGVIGPMYNGDALGNCGQIDNTIREHLNAKKIHYTEGWNSTKTFQLLELWDEYHLNDLQAGCEHQRAEKWEDVRISKSELPNIHANSDERGIMAMWVTEEEHIDGLLSKPCTTCGYKYGSAWLTKALPKNILTVLESFKKAQREPAWV